VISENIIKNDLFEILIGENNEMVFEDEIYKRITEKIKDRNETSLLLKIYYLFEDDTLILNTLKNILQDSILNEASDQIPFADIIRYYEKIGVTSEWRNVKILKDFLNFKLNQTDETFNQLVFFRDEEIEKSFIIEAKYVFEKIVMLVSSYIQRHHRNDLARKVFIISGELGLSEDCLEYVRSKLVLMI
ncbi:putative Nup93/Nic96-like nuclear pore protein, partial [Hamiltosporidium magnivora]